MNKKFIGEKIKNRRKQIKMTQFELAEKIGLHEKHISRIESGQNFPNLDSFFKILEVLDLKMSDFDADCVLIQGKTRDELNYILNNSTQEDLELYLDLIKVIINKKRQSVNN
ncbi:helix-turn-helix transcriptional regulator [bacterium]|nr:helix-turn-helix transcriptional regulator [bacterium]